MLRGEGKLMLKDRRNAAMKIAGSLLAAEDAIDTALARAAELNGTMVVARTDANLSALVGHDAFEGSAAVFAALARARSDIVETHKRLSEARIQIGLRTVDIGDLPPKADEGENGSRHLQIVA
jgi:hypothetical protein